MKIGAFVGQVPAPIGKDAVEEIKNRFSKILKETFGKDFEIEISNGGDEVCNGSMTFTAKNVMQSDTFRVMNGDGWCTRTGDLIRPSGEITLMLFSQMGYDEAVHGPFYEWEELGHPADWRPENDIHSFSMKVLWHGIHKMYRHKYWYGLSVKDAYLYGTELSDLDFENNIRTIHKVFTNSVKTK